MKERLRGLDISAMEFWKENERERERGEEKNAETYSPSVISKAQGKSTVIRYSYGASLNIQRATQITIKLRHSLVILRRNDFKDPYKYICVG